MFIKTVERIEEGGLGICSECRYFNQSVIAKLTDNRTNEQDQWLMPVILVLLETEMGVALVQVFETRAEQHSEISSL